MDRLEKRYLYGLAVQSAGSVAGTEASNAVTTVNQVNHTATAHRCNRVIAGYGFEYQQPHAFFSSSRRCPWSTCAGCCPRTRASSSCRCCCWRGSARWPGSPAASGTGTGTPTRTRAARRPNREGCKYLPCAEALALAARPSSGSYEWRRLLRTVFYLDCVVICSGR